MSNLVLEIEDKDTSVNPRQLRATGKIPATIYSKGVESVSIQLEERGLRAALRTALKDNKDAVVELKGAKTSYKAIVKNVQSKAISDQILCVEFQQVK